VKNILHLDNSSFVWFHRILDAFLPLGMLFCITQFLNIPWHDRYLTMGLLGGMLFTLSAQTVGIYQSWRGRPLFTSFKLIMTAWIISWLVLIFFAFLAKDTQNFSRLVITIWAVLVPSMFILYRIAIRTLIAKLRSKGLNTQNIAIIGAGKVGQQVAEALAQSPWLGYKVTAFIDDNPALINSEINGTPVVSNTKQTIQIINQYHIHEIYICLPMRAEEKIKEILNQLTDTTAIVKFVPDIFTFDLMHAKFTELKGLPIISIYDSPLNSTTAKFLKRVEDIVLSSIILMLISPVMVVLAIGVKLTSPGPIFYRQTRVGWNGKNFEMLKFRSMPVDVEKNGVQWGSAKNKTNTKFGQFIRATSLDELPQFINVLKGDMSIVGPRPERDIFVEKFRKEIPRYMQKHMVKAGITGWAQINGWRGDTSLEKRIEFDLHYINNWSLWLDIKIIFLTLFKGFINKNAC